MVLCLLAFLTLVLLSIGLPSQNRPLQRILGSEVAFGSLAVIFIVLARSSTWIVGQCDVDEAEWLAGSVTLNSGYDFWRVDGTTSGPLIIQFLWVWGLVCGINSFQAAKVLTTIVSCAICLLSYFSIRTFCDRPSARAISLPTMLTFGFMRSGSFIGYNGEQLPMLLLALASILLLRIVQSNRQSHALAAALGIVLGILPYSKPQAIPMGFLLGIFGIWLMYRHVSVLSLLVTTLVVVCAPLAWMFQAGQLSDFLTSFVLENLEYAATHSSLPLLKRVYAFPLVWLSIHEGFVLVVGSLLAIVACGLSGLFRRTRLQNGDQSILLGAIGYLGIAGYCVMQPGTFFPHYYLFMFHPLSLAIAAFSEFGLRGLASPVRDRICQAWSAAALAGLCVMQTPDSFEFPSLNGTLASPHGDVSAAILENAEGHSRLTVWGWACHLHVESKLPQATSEGHTQRQIERGRYQEYFLKRYVSQLRSRQSGLIFVDATNSGESKYFGDAQFSHENYPEVKEFVDRHLEFVGTVNGCRIYRGFKEGAN